MGGIEAMARRRLGGAMHAVAVVLPRANVVQVAVPDLVRVLRQGDALQLAAAGAVEEAELDLLGMGGRSEEHTSELQSLMRISYAVFCLTKKKQQIVHQNLSEPTLHNK